MKLASRFGLAAAAAATTSLLAGSAASADQIIFLDKTGDAPGHIDITRVKVDNGTTQPRYVKVRLTIDRKIHPGNGIRIYYDTNRSNAGPEYLLEGVAQSEYWFRTVPGWTDDGHPTASRVVTTDETGPGRPAEGAHGDPALLPRGSEPGQDVRADA